MNQTKDMTDFTDYTGQPVFDASAVPVKPSRRFVKILSFILKISVTCVLLTFIVNKIQFQEIRADWQDVNGFILIAGLIITIPNLLVQHFKWRYLVRIIDHEISDKEIFRSLLYGFSVGLITPGRLGEMGRGLFLDSPAKAQMIGMGIIDKILSLLALSVICLFGSLGLILLQELPFTTIHALLLALIVLFISFLLVIIFFPEQIRQTVRTSKRLMYRLPWRNKLFALLSAVDYFKRSHFIPAMSYALLFQCIVLTQYYVILCGFSTADFFAVAALTGLAFFGKAILPVAVMDLGVREGALLFFLSRLDLPSSSIFNASIFLFLSNVLLPGILGSLYFIYYNILRKNPSSLNTGGV